MNPQPTLSTIASFQALLHAAQKARRGKRLTRASAAFFVDLETELFRLERELLAGTWQPGGYRSFTVKDPKPRIISAAPFRDRVVHHALCAAIGPVLEDLASDASCACRVGRGTHHALQRARKHIQNGRDGWFIKLDVRRYFETVDHALLLAETACVLRDKGIQDLVARILAAGAPGSPAKKGLPIGNLTSQHLANFHLTPFDDWVAATAPNTCYTRYMDDLLFIVPDRPSALALESACVRFLAEKRLLEVKAEATRRGPVRSGVPFLGFRIWPNHIRLDRYRKRRLGRRLKEVQRELAVTGDDTRAGMRASSLLGWASLADAGGLVRSFLHKMV